VLGAVQVALRAPRACGARPLAPIRGLANVDGPCARRGWGGAFVSKVER
jgi:hypothetical protein